MRVWATCERFLHFFYEHDLFVKEFVCLWDIEML